MEFKDAEINTKMQSKKALLIIFFLLFSLSLTSHTWKKIKGLETSVALTEIYPL